MIKRSHLAVFAFIVVAGCGGSGSSAPAPPAVGTDACSIDGQKQYVLDTMRDVYFWYDLLPANVDIGACATPEELLADLISVQPLDNFSYIDSLAADAQFFPQANMRGLGLVRPSLRLTICVSSVSSHPVLPQSQASHVASRLSC